MTHAQEATAADTARFLIRKVAYLRNEETSCRDFDDRIGVQHQVRTAEQELGIWIAAHPEALRDA